MSIDNAAVVRVSKASLLTSYHTAGSRSQTFVSDSSFIFTICYTSFRISRNTTCVVGTVICCHTSHRIGNRNIDASLSVGGTLYHFLIGIDFSAIGTITDGSFIVADNAAGCLFTVHFCFIATTGNGSCRFIFAGNTTYIGLSVQCTAAGAATDRSFIIPSNDTDVFLIFPTGHRCLYRQVCNSSIWSYITEESIIGHFFLETEARDRMPAAVEGTIHDRDKQVFILRQINIFCHHKSLSGGKILCLTTVCQQDQILC